MVERELPWLVREEASQRLRFFFKKKNIESMASVSLQPRQKRDLWLRVMTEAERDAFWPRFNMPRFLNRDRISKETGAKRGTALVNTQIIFTPSKAHQIIKSIQQNQNRHIIYKSIKKILALDIPMGQPLGPID